MKPTREQVTSFEENGFLVCGQVLSDAEVAELQERYDAVFEAERKETQSRVSDFAKDTGRSMQQLVNMYLLDDAFNRLLYHPGLLDIAESLIGSNIRLFHDQALYKPANHGDDVPWHQDDAYWILDPPSAVSCWMALDNATVENGCMHLIPGSYKLGLLPHRSHLPGKHVHLLEVEGIDRSKAVAVELPAGHCLFHHCRTVHYTPPNSTPHRRRAMVVHYMPADTKREGKYMPEHPLLRGESLVPSTV